MRSVVVGAIGVLLACNPTIEADDPMEGGQSRQSAEDILLSVHPAAASAGDSVELVLSNNASGAVGYNLCSSHLERQAGGDWEAIRENRVCTMELRNLPAGDETRYPLALPSDLGPGLYRAVTNVERSDSGGRVTVRSSPFEING